MTMNKQKEMDEFWEDVFNPKGDDLIRVNAHSIAGQYLKQIERVLENKKLSQKDLAKKVGTSASYISQLFNDDKLPSFKMLARIELALDIEFDVQIRKNIKLPNIIADDKQKEISKNQKLKAK